MKENFEIKYSAARNSVPADHPPPHINIYRHGTYININILQIRTSYIPVPYIYILNIRLRRAAWCPNIYLLFATGVSGHDQPVGHPCSTWVQHAMKVMKDMGVKLGQNNFNLEWDWHVSATRRSTWAVAN